MKNFIPINPLSLIGIYHSPDPGGLGLESAIPLQTALRTHSKWAKSPPKKNPSPKRDYIQIPRKRKIFHTLEIPVEARIVFKSANAATPFAIAGFLGSSSAYRFFFVL